MMDPPSIPPHHLRELKSRFPYAFYVWNRELALFELWCDEGRGSPYQFMILAGPQGEYRPPGGWVIDELRRTDAETGERKFASKLDRSAWIQSLYDETYSRKLRADQRDKRMRTLREDARFFKRHGRVYATH